MTSLGVAILIAGLATMAFVAFCILRSLWPVRDARLMRCPETGAIAFVAATSVSRRGGAAPEVTVRSCDLWPERKNCGRGCLVRYSQTASGYPVSVEALRPFEQP